MTLLDKETALDDLPGEAQVLAILVTNSSDRGIYWLDLENHKLYMAKEVHSNVPPDKGAMTWTGTQLVYGQRLEGFYSLASNGDHQQITSFDHMGKIARNGEQILRFRKCDPDETGAGYTVTPLDRFTDPPLICLPRPSSGLDHWFSIHPIWNPHLARADFVISKRSGQGKDRLVESNKLVQVLENGDLGEIADLGPELSFEAPQIYFQSRPDGEAFYIHNPELNATRIIDRQGAVLVDFAELDARLPHLQRTSRFSWSPDSQKAVMLFRDCRQDEKACGSVLVLAANDFKDLSEISTLPAKFRFNRFIWSPDSTHFGLVTEIHQGKEDPPRIRTVNLTDRSEAEFVFPARFILRHVQWVR